MDLLACFWIHYVSWMEVSLFQVQTEDMSNRSLHFFSSKSFIVYFIRFYVSAERYSFFIDISLSDVLEYVIFDFQYNHHAILHGLIPQQAKMYLQNKDYSRPDLWKWSEWLEWDISYHRIWLDRYCVFNSVSELSNKSNHYWW